MNMVAYYATGRVGMFAPIWSYMIVLLLGTAAFLAFKDKLWELANKYGQLALVIILAVFVTGVILTYIGAI